MVYEAEYLKFEITDGILYIQTGKLTGIPGEVIWDLVAVFKEWRSLYDESK